MEDTLSLSTAISLTCKDSGREEEPEAEDIGKRGVGEYETEGETSGGEETSEGEETNGDGFIATEDTDKVETEENDVLVLGEIFLKYVDIGLPSLRICFFLGGPLLSQTSTLCLVEFAEKNTGTKWLGLKILGIR